MGFFDDVAKVVKAVVENPIPVIVGGGLLGPVGTVIGALDVTAEAEHKKALQAYVENINQAITTIKATKPNYEYLKPIWIQFYAEAYQAAYKDKYGAACPPPEVLAPMISIDIDSLRKSLTDEAYHLQLDEIHNASVNASVMQLEHERDNPNDQDKPSGLTDQLNQFLSDIANTIAHWLESRFNSNFEGAKSESGFGAKILRGAVGISWEDIKSRGLLGGDNSYLRKIIPTWADNGGVFGGENSFFRKPFG